MARRRHHNNSNRAAQFVRPPTARSAWRRSVTPPVTSSVRDLVWIEMEPLLKGERARCEAISQELRNATEKLEHFKSRWEPSFSRWYYSQFGEKLTKARDLETRAHELERLIAQVETEALLTGDSERVAYERLQRIRAGLDRLDEMRADPDADDAELPQEVLDMLKHKLDELLGDGQIPKAEYKRLFEKFKQEFREQLAEERTEEANARDEYSEAREEAEAEAARAQNRSERRRAKHADAPQSELPFPSPPDADDSRRKQLYRELARKLHPDLNPGLSARERELWHEVQDAYDAQDLEQLEMLASMTEGTGGQGFGWIKSLSKLRAHFVELQRKLRASHKALRQAKQSPAWNFNEATGQPVKATETSLQVEWELTDAICSLEEEVARFELRINRWKNGAVPRSQKKRRR